MNNHGEFLRAVTNDDALVHAIQNDYTKADLSAQERAMLDYAVKLNDAPTRITESDVDALRQAGFDDRAIVDIAMLTSVINFNNRFSCALGVYPHTPNARV